MAPFISRTGLNANFITFIRLPFIVIASALISVDYLTLSNKFIASFFIFLFSFLDALDGEVALLTKKTFLGKWMDPQIDRLGLTAILISLFFAIKSNEESSFQMFLLLLGCCLWWITINNISDFQYKPKYINSFKNLENKKEKISINTLDEEKKLKSFLSKLISNIVKIMKWANLNTFLHLHNICLLLIFSLLIGRLEIFVYSFFFRSLVSYLQIIYLHFKKVKTIDLSGG